MTPPKALTFDVFGTVVDWRSSIIGEMRSLAARHGIHGDWGAFADAWRAGYRPAMDRVASGELPWTKIDHLHRMILNEIAPRFGLNGLSEEELDELNSVWHRLEPWPDAVGGLQRLRQSFHIASLSNGNVSLLVNMAKNAGLPWDSVYSAEMAACYKPDPAVYRKAAEWLGLAPNEVMMVAAHVSDLRAAAEVGFQTAFVARPLEHGPDGPRERLEAGEFDLVASDFLDLAAILGG